MTLPTIQYHPLAFVTITQNLTSITLNTPTPTPHMGLLFGYYTETTNTLTITHTTQLPTQTFSTHTIESLYFHSQTNPQNTIIGWYKIPTKNTLSTELLDEHTTLHENLKNALKIEHDLKIENLKKEILNLENLKIERDAKNVEKISKKQEEIEFLENNVKNLEMSLKIVPEYFLFLDFDLNKCDAKNEKIPVKFFIQKNNLFLECEKIMISNEAERVIVNDVINGSSNDLEKKKRERETNEFSVLKLKKNIEILVTYLKNIENDLKIECDAKNCDAKKFDVKDEEILKNIADICSSLPISDNDVFKNEFEHVRQDSKLVNLMMQILQSSIVLEEHSFSFKELTKEYSTKVRKEEDKKRHESRVMHEYMGMGNMMPGMMGFGQRGMREGYDNYLMMEDDDD